MNTFSKLFLRTPVFTAALVVLLALSACFSCIGFSAWGGAMRQRSSIEAQYTTLAMPLPFDYKAVENEIAKRIGLEIDEYGNYLWEDDTVTYSLKYIDKIAAEAPQVKRKGKSGLLSAALKGLRGLSANDFRQNINSDYFDFTSYSFSVLAVKCISVSNEGQLDSYPLGYDADFEIIGAPSLAGVRGDVVGKYLNIGYACAGLLNSDGTVPFEAGKQYMVRGFFYDTSWDPLSSRRDDEELEKNHVRMLYMYDAYRYDEYGTEVIENADKDVWPEVYDIETAPTGNDSEYVVQAYYYAPAEGSLPYWAEYTGDWREFLNSSDGAVWRDEIIPLTKINQNSAAWVLTDDLNGIYNFNTGKALVMEGRAFSVDEYANGDDVCLISAAFAGHNGLSVGSTVEVDLYDTGSESFEPSALGDLVYRRCPMTSSNRMDIVKSYTVIGIYTSPEFSVGQNNFTADTIFVPKKSVPDAEKYEDARIAYLNSFVIYNGTQNDFEKFMADNDLPGKFVYSDMGYKDVAPVLDALLENAVRIIAIALAVLVLVAAVGIYLTISRMKPAIRSERLVGVKRGMVWRGISGVFSAVIGISVALGALLGALLYGNITKAIFETSVELNLPALIACAAGEFILLTAAAMLAAVPAASPNLMNSGRVKRKK